MATKQQHHDDLQDTFLLLSPSPEIHTNFLAGRNAYGQSPVGKKFAESSWLKNRNSALWEIPGPLFSLKINWKSKKSKLCRMTFPSILLEYLEEKIGQPEFSKPQLCGMCAKYKTFWTFLCCNSQSHTMPQ